MHSPAGNQKIALSVVSIISEFKRNHLPCVSIINNLATSSMATTNEDYCMITKMSRVISFCPPMTSAMGTTSAFIECQQEPPETLVKLCQRD